MPPKPRGGGAETAETKGSSRGGDVGASLYHKIHQKHRTNSARKIQSSFINLYRKLHQKKSVLFHKTAGQICQRIQSSFTTRYKVHPEKSIPAWETVSKIPPENSVLLQKTITNCTRNSSPPSEVYLTAFNRQRITNSTENSGGNGTPMCGGVL